MPSVKVTLAVNPICSNEVPDDSHSTTSIGSIAEKLSIYTVTVFALGDVHTCNGHDRLMLIDRSELEL